MNPEHFMFCGLVLCRISSAIFAFGSFASTTAHAAWIDSATGLPVHTIPIRTGEPADPLSNFRTNAADSNHAQVGNKTLYWDKICTWRDAANGQEVQTIPIRRGKPADPLSNYRKFSADPNHADDNGKTLVWIPCLQSDAHQTQAIYITWLRWRGWWARKAGYRQLEQPTSPVVGKRDFAGKDKLPTRRSVSGFGSW